MPGHRAAASAITARMRASTCSGFSFRDHPAVQLEAHRAGHDVGIGAAFDAADVQVRVRDAGHRRANRCIPGVLRIERLQDLDGGLQRIDTGVRNRRMGHRAVHGHFHLQAAVVRGDDLVRKTGRDHQVGPRQFFAQQPAWAQFSAKLLVVGEQQFHATVQRDLHGFQCAQRKRIGGEVALADGGSAAIQHAVFNLAAVGVVRPAVARRHDVAVGVERDGGALAIVPAHDEIGDGLHACGLHIGGRHGVFLGDQSHGT